MCAFACRSGASAVCVCVLGGKCDCVRVSVGGMRILCTCAPCARTHPKRARAFPPSCIGGGRREEPELSYFKLFLLSDCLASQLSACLSSSICEYFLSSPLLPPPLLGWMMAYDCPDGCYSSTLALTRLGIASSTYLGIGEVILMES